MQMSGGGADGPDDFEHELRRSLFRFDCPDAHKLGEYQLDLLEEAQRVQVAAHALECDECRAELQTLRGFLATAIEPPAGASIPGQVRRIVATLFAPRPGLAYGGLRGGPDTSTRVFEAGDVTVTLGPGQTNDSLFGLVVSGGISPEALEGREARLLPREGAPIVTRIDDLGNFEFTDLSAGMYALELDLPDSVVVIEELRVD